MDSQTLIANGFASLGAIYLLVVTVPLSRIDIREHRLPNRLVLPALPITLAGLLIASFITHAWLQIGFSLITFLIALIAGLVANRFASLGMGDVKLIAAISFSLSWFSPINPLIALLVAFVIAGAVVIGLLVLRKTTLGSAIALGPYLLAGFAVTQILTWSSYLGGFSPNFLM